MRKFLIIPALTLARAMTAGLAVAADEDVRVDVPRDQWLTVAQIAEKISAQGFDLREIEVEKSGYEVKFIDRDGKHVEADVHPVTGEILKSKQDD